MDQLAGREQVERRVTLCVATLWQEVGHRDALAAERASFSASC
jgi:hypothetical protein